MVSAATPERKLATCQPVSVVALIAAPPVLKSRAAASSCRRGSTVGAISLVWGPGGPERSRRGGTRVAAGQPPWLDPDARALVGPIRRGAGLLPRAGTRPAVSHGIA